MTEADRQRLRNGGVALLLVFGSWFVLDRALLLPGSQRLGLATAWAIAPAVRLTRQAWKLRVACSLSALATMAVLGPTTVLWLVVLATVTIFFAAALQKHLGRSSWLLWTLAVLGLATATDIVPRNVWLLFGSLVAMRLPLVLATRLRDCTPTQLVGYLTLFPNALFPMFPLVDFQRFRRGPEADQDFRILLRGALWTANGVSHLAVYRWSQHLVSLPAEEVADASSLARHAAGLLLLYLHLSGTFHLLAGALCLQGFDLPPTHRLFFLSSSLQDLWQRINVYWKDAMSRLVFFPMLDQTRRFAPRASATIATLAVFVATWFLHEAQSFWLTGAFALRATDVLFWAGLGSLVAWSVFRDFHRPRERQSTSWLVRGLGIARTQLVLAGFWTLWMSESPAAFAALCRRAGFGALVWPAAVLLFLGLEKYLRMQPAPLQRSARQRPADLSGLHFMRRATAGLLITAALATLLVADQNRLGQELRTLAVLLAEQRPRAADADHQNANYYERLLVSRPAWSTPWQQSAPTDWKRIHDSEMWQERGDLRLGELRSGRWRFKGSWVSVDERGRRTTPRSDGLRRNDIAACRVAVLGSSYVMGSGVEDDQVFVAGLQRRLDRRGHEARLTNFGIAGYSLLQQAALAEDELTDDEFDVVVLISHRDLLQRNGRRLAQAVEQGKDLRFRFLKDLIGCANTGAPDKGKGKGGCPPGSKAREDQLDSSQALVAGAAESVAAWTFRRIADTVGATSRKLWVFVPLTTDNQPQAAEQLEALARAAGFETHAIDPFAGHTLAELRVAPWDNHPSPLAHELIAEAMMQSLEPEVAKCRHAPRDRTAPMPRTLGIADRVRDFLSRDVLFDLEPADLTLSTPLLDGGLLDSMGVLRLRLFLEEEFDIELTADDLDFDRLRDLKSIEQLVASRVDGI